MVDREASNAAEGMESHVKNWILRHAVPRLIVLRSTFSSSLDTNTANRRTFWPPLMNQQAAAS